MNADWREEMLDEVMGFILDTVHDGRVPDLQAIEDGFPQVKEDPQLRAEVESILEMHQWFDDSIGDWQDSVAETEGPPDETPKRPARPIGNRWGDFVLVEELGRGGMGQVFKAWQISKRRFVALKRLDSRLLGDEQARTRFQREPQHMMGIKHRGIVRVLEVGEHAGHPYFTMELVDGVSLGVLARNQALPPDQIARIMRQVSRSVSVAHKGKILHRDLKPDNILLTRELEAKVGDFGLAKDLGHDTGLTRSLDVLGTCNYMAPEQAAGKSDQIGVRTDVYGLGAVLYELLTARPPFRGENTGEVLLQVQDVEPVAPRTINPLADEKLEAICLKCLEKKPDARYASATELAEEFERVLHGKRPLAPFNSAARRMWRFCRRRPALASLVVVSVLAATGFSVAGVVFQQQRVVLQEQRMAVQEQRVVAREEKLRADEESHRAEQEEAKRRLADAGAAASSGLRHLQSGQWEEAIESIDQAIALGYPRSADMRLNKSRCLIALDRVPEAIEELTELNEDPDLPEELNASVDLWMGDAFLGRDNDKALSYIKRAVEQGLSATADKEYAQGLLAKDLATCVRHLQATLRIEPYHQRAGRMLVFNLFVLGRFEEAAQSLEVAMAFYPHDAELWVFKSLVLIMQDKPEQASELLSECQGKLGPERFVAAKDITELLKDLRDPAKLSEMSLFDIVKRCGTTVLKLTVIPRTASGEVEGPFIVMPPVLKKSYGELAMSVLGSSILPWDRWGARVKTLEDATRVHPEGTLFLMLGKAYKAKSRWPEAVAALEKAVELPALTRAQPEAISLLALVRWQMSRELPEKEMAEQQSQAISEVYRLTEDWPVLKSFYLANLTEMARTSGDLHLARIVAREFRRQHPDNGHADELAGYIEMDSENFASALKCFTRALANGGANEVRVEERAKISRQHLVKQATAPDVLIPVARVWLGDQLRRVLAALEGWQSSVPSGDSDK